jgi:hypothetical protein
LFFIAVWGSKRHFIPLSITNKMQRYTIFFMAVSAVHVSGSFSAHHQELKLYTQHLVYVKLACCYCKHGWVGSALPTHPWNM